MLSRSTVEERDMRITVSLRALTLERSVRYPGAYVLTRSPEAVPFCASKGLPADIAWKIFVPPLQLGMCES